MPALWVGCTGGFALLEDRGVPQYTRSPSEGTTPSSTDNALPKDLRRAYLVRTLAATKKEKQFSRETREKKYF